MSVVFLRSRLLPLPLPPPWGSDSIRRTRCKLSLSRQRGPTLPPSSPVPHSAPPPFLPQSWSPGSLSDVVSSRTPPLLPQPPRSLEIPALMYRRCPHRSAALPPLRRRAGTVPSTFVPDACPLASSAPELIPLSSPPVSRRVLVRGDQPTHMLQNLPV